MKKESEKKVLATVLSAAATSMLSSAANSRCVFVFHQPKQPEGVKRFKK